MFGESMKKIQLFLFVSLFLLPTISWGQIAAWDFTGAGNTATATATTFNSNLVSASGANNITRGAGASASSGANSFRTTGFKNDGISTSNTDYFQITLTAADGYKLSLSTIDAKFNGTAGFYASPGVTSQFAYSLDGSTFTLIESPVQSTSLTMTQIDLSGIVALQNVAAGTTITLRYYASGQTTTGGWGFISSALGQNGLAIGGTVVAAGGGAPTKLVVTTINGSSSPSTNTPFSVTVQAQDNSNVAQNVSANTDIILSRSGGTGSLGGTLTGTISAGSNIVTISGVTYNTAESEVSITATRTSGDVLTAGTSSTFTVLEAATQLVFVNIPTGGQPNISLNSFTVEARRSDASVDLNFTGNILVDKASGTGVISGTQTQAASSGVATFSDIKLDASGFYTISASSTGPTGTTSGSINILSTSLPLAEDFDFTSSTTLVSDGWIANSGAGTNSITVNSGSLTYTGYTSSGVVNKVAIGTSGEDVYRTFDQVTSNSIYVAFMVSVSTATTAGDYFITLSTNPEANTNYTARVFAKDDGSGNLSFGIAKTGTTTYASGIYAYNTTHLIVIKYTFNTGSSVDDITGIYIDPSVPGVEPATLDAQGTVSDADNSGIGSVVLRQGTAANAPTLTLDGIRIATSWGEVPLPVELTSFTANAFNSSVQLKWQTATEVNNYGFEIQRLNSPLASSPTSRSGLNPLPGGEEKGWMKIGFVNGNGNSSSTKDYTFVDPAIGTGKNISSGKYSYRLKQIDNNGAYKYSNVVEVSFMKPAKFALEQNYPNPFNPSTTITFSIPEDGHIVLKLYDVLGREVQTLINENRKAGIHNINFYADNLSNGVYMYKLTAGNYSDIKKMILLK